MAECFKIGIIGPESTGKSTLARYLARRYKGTYVPEYARTYVEQKGSREVTFDELCEIAKHQIEEMESLTNHLRRQGRTRLYHHRPAEPWRLLAGCEDWRWRCGKDPTC